MPKYKILKNEKNDFCGKTLYRIKALKDFTLIDGTEIKAGDLGGYVQSRKNLSQRGSCWICENAYVFDNARVYGNAMVSDWSCVYKNARVHGNSKVFNRVFVFDNADVGGNAKVFNNACVFDIENPTVFSKVIDYNHNRGRLTIGGDAYVHNDNDYIFITNLSLCNQNVIFYKCKNGHVGVHSDISRTLDEFISKVKDSYDERYVRTFYGRKSVADFEAALEAVKIHFGLDKNTSATEV